MKKKIVVAALAAIVAVTAIAGATLAYFTDHDDVTNAFTMKGIDITLEEEFTQGAELIPGLDVNKDVYVTNNEGSSDAYVRVHIAIPAALDDGDPSFNASQNFLHFNFTNASVADGQWSWLPEMSEGTGYKGNGVGNWNYYTTTIDNVEYAVYVVTYRTALKGGETTATQALDKVYLDKSVDAELVEGEWVYTDNKGNTVNPDDFGGTVQIKVFAEAAQTATFDNAYDALNTAFGTPGSEGYVAPWNR